MIDLYSIALLFIYIMFIAILVCVYLFPYCLCVLVSMATTAILSQQWLTQCYSHCTESRSTILGPRDQAIKMMPTIEVVVVVVVGRSTDPIIYILIQLNAPHTNTRTCDEI